MNNLKTIIPNLKSTWNKLFKNPNELNSIYGTLFMNITTREGAQYVPISKSIETKG